MFLCFLRGGGGSGPPAPSRSAHVILTGEARVFPGKASRTLVESRGLPSDSTCVLEALILKDAIVSYLIYQLTSKLRYTCNIESKVRVFWYPVYRARLRERMTNRDSTSAY